MGGGAARRTAPADKLPAIEMILHPVSDGPTIGAACVRIHGFVFPSNFFGPFFYILLSYFFTSFVTWIHPKSLLTSSYACFQNFIANLWKKIKKSPKTNFLCFRAHLGNITFGDDKPDIRTGVVKNNTSLSSITFYHIFAIRSNQRFLLSNCCDLEQE
ncbi:hypothetical protein [Pseudoflavonifractor phocaeensis]|uniref:hypothetical protein n=1 Tax=Pseudoflavonifractor phocaeensis TaxID=1870988 RepID=UPI001959B1C5|nr:hypothetical protein [Pseudoflavonifractor phocaeensis]MBM6723940.1 hypothetical protein [Pseudoflavonifractor phocaeensis]